MNDDSRRIDEDLRVIAIDPLVDPRWGRFVDETPDGLIFHHPLWLEVLQREYGGQCIGVACEDHAGALTGVLPLFETRGLPFGIGGPMAAPRLSSLPRTPLAGILARSDRAAELLAEAAVARLDIQSGQRLQIKSFDTRLDGRVEGLGRQRWRVSYGVALPEIRRTLGADECFARNGPCDSCRALRFGNCDNHRRVTWAVNKARKQNVTVSDAGSEAELETWYDIYLETMRRNVVPPRSLRFFKSCWELLHGPGLMRLLITRDAAGRMIGGAILFTYHHRTFAAFAASRERDFGLHPNDVVHWTGIHDACRHGDVIYDFGEVPSDAPNLARFKKKWNCTETDLARYTYPAEASNDMAPDEPSALRRLAARAWHRLPLRATALIGDWLYGFM